jgi:nucleoside-diphosphate-sugar epimerase
MHIAPEPVWNTIPNRNWDASVWVSDNRKIRAQLGWEPRRSFTQGLGLMVDWFRQGPLPCYAGKPPEKPGS